MELIEKQVFDLKQLLLEQGLFAVIIEVYKEKDEDNPNQFSL